MADLIKISDSTNTTSSVVAASSTAVKAAMDKANSAATAASNAQATADSKLSEIIAGTGITVSGNKVGLATCGSAGTAGSSSAQTLAYSGTFTIPYITTDAYGRVTAKGTRTLTMPATPSVTNISGTAAKATACTSVQKPVFSGSKMYLPSGGTWFYWVDYYDGDGDSGEACGTGSGGAQIASTSKTIKGYGICIRTA